MLSYIQSFIFHGSDGKVAPSVFDIAPIFPLCFASLAEEILDDLLDVCSRDLDKAVAGIATSTLSSGV